MILRITIALYTVGLWVRQLLCKHSERMFRTDEQSVYTECLHCGHTTEGWECNVGMRRAQ